MIRISKWAKKLHKLIAKSEEDEHVYLMDFIQMLKHRTESNKDAVIAVCGERGMGKSSFAIVTGLILRDLGMDFELDHVFYGTHDLRSAITKIVNSRSSVFIFDEMIDFAYSRDAMSSMNKNIAKILTKSRKLNNIYFFCIPRFRNLDTTIRNDVVHYWIEVFWKSNAKDRDKRFAFANFFRKDKNPLAYDPWGLEFSEHMKKRTFSGLQQLELAKKIRSYVCTFKFPPIPKPLEKQYEEISRDSLKIAGDAFLSKMTKQTKASETIR